MPEMTPKRLIGWLITRPARQAVVQRHRAGAGAVAHVERVVLDVAHALDAAGDHHVGRAGLHHHRRVDHRLQAASRSGGRAGSRDVSIGKSAASAAQRAMQGASPLP